MHKREIRTHLLSTCDGHLRHLRIVVAREDRRCYSDTAAGRDLAPRDGSCM